MLAFLHAVLSVPDARGGPRYGLQTSLACAGLTVHAGRSHPTSRFRLSFLSKSKFYPNESYNLSYS